MSKTYLAGEDVLWRGIGGIQEQHVDALLGQGCMAAHARVPAHVPSVQDDLDTLPVSIDLPQTNVLVCISDTPDFSLYTSSLISLSVRGRTR